MNAKQVLSKCLSIVTPSMHKMRRLSLLTVEESVSEQEWQDIAAQTKANGKLKIIREIAIKDQKGQIVAVSKATYFAMLVKK